MTSTGWVVIGAGPHALTVTAELVVDGLADPDELVVLDPTGRWLVQWQRAFDRLGITHLRSPVVHHPHPDVDAILRRPDLQDGDVTAGEVPVPSQRVFLDVAHDLVDTLGLHRCVHPARARSLHVVPDGTARVECDDAATIHAERVVVATNTAVPVTVHGLVPCAVPAPPRVSATDHVVVIGGGLTAAQVARRVVAAGARLTLVTRRPIVERAFDVDPGWMGPKHLAGYTQLETPAARLEAVRAARDGGSMPAGDHAWLRQLASAGRIDLCEGDPATAVERDGEERIVHLAGGRDVRCDVVVAALGSRFDVEHDPLLGPFVASGQLRSLDGYPQLDPALRVPGTSIHACGRAATLELGPAAGNLSGARRAARRISAHVAGVDPVAADPGVSNRPVVPSRCGPAVVASRSWAG